MYTFKDKSHKHLCKLHNIPPSVTLRLSWYAGSNRRPPAHARKDAIHFGKSTSRVGIDCCIINQFTLYICTRVRVDMNNIVYVSV